MARRVTGRDVAMMAFYKGSGMTNRAIAQKMGYSHSTIDAHLQLLFQDTPPKETLVKQDLFGPAIRQFILTRTLKDRFISCRKLSKLIESIFQETCCKSKVAEIRKSLGLLQLWAKKTEKLDESHINARYAFAQRIQRLPCFELPWIISDESSFVLCHQHRKLYRFRGENSEAVFQEFAGYPIKCMVWGAIGPISKVS
jgi:hypothetical protein